MTRTSKGFTLIELLVVIAIIGILSAVVLASLNTGRDKSADAAIKSSLNNARAQSELFYDSNGNKYVGTAGTANDICSSTANASGVKGVYSFLQGALQTPSSRDDQRVDRFVIRRQTLGSDHHARRGPHPRCVGGDVFDPVGRDGPA